MTAQPIAPGSPRLPRYSRAEAEVYLQLTPRDLGILRLVESFRLASSEHIRALAPGSDQGILRRLQVLFHAGYLDRLRPSYVEKGGSAKMVYAITNKGRATLQKDGSLKEVSRTDRNAQNRDLREPFIRHRLLVSHIRATFLLACREHATSDLQFLFWREGREIQDRIEVALPEKYAAVPVAADGFFAMQNAQGRRSHLFVEADCGSMQIQRFILKLQAYAAYWRAGKHTEKFGIKNFRVLTVTSSAARCKNLREAAKAAEDIRAGASLFLFATEKDLPLSSPESVFAKIWTMCGRDEPCSIL